MERVQKICANRTWLENVDRLQILEGDRVFCRHTLEHFLDVARIAWIEDLEKDLCIPKALIYAAALLHDIGRARQYLDGTPHDRAGAELAEEILRDCGFGEEERDQILSAIGRHRDPETKYRDDLAGLIYRADKLSRMCLFCRAEPECNWDKEKKNLKISV